MLQRVIEQEVTVGHTTIMRWVRHYVPEYERRGSRFSKPTHASWRMDETSVSVGGRWNYLYRAVDRHGESVHYSPPGTVSRANAC
jgi:transposase-like protein